ncbi:MAG: universal stress protein [Rubrobacteraceae bacterium]
MSAYPRKVLLATDGSEDSIRAAHAAIAIAGSADSELHIVHVGQAPAPQAGASAARPPLPGEPSGYAEKEARKLLEGQAKTVEAAGGKVSETHLRLGQPGAEVISVAAEIDADMIVVGSGGPRPVRRAVAATTRRAALGRASDIIVRSAHCPVLIVRGDAALDDEGF